MKKIMLVSLMLFVFAGLFGCEYQEEERNPLQDVEVGTMDDYSFDDSGIEIKTINDARLYLLYNMEYTSDDNDYWQLPEETFNLKTGDCEDYAIMLMYLLKIKLNIDSELIMVCIGNDKYHAVCYNKYTKKYCDRQNEYTEQNLPQNYKILWRCSYEKTIWMAYYYHTDCGKFWF